MTDEYVKRRTTAMLTHSDLLKLKRWNTPTIYNGWEAITMQERLDVRCNRR